MKDVAEWVGETNPGQEYRIYSDYPFPFRKNGGPLDEFETRALEEFRSGGVGESFELEERPEGTFLKAAFQIKMEQACVDCHNELATSPKSDWKVGDVRGATSMSMNLPSVPSFFTTENLRWQLPGLTALLALLAVPGIAFMISRLRTKELIKSERLAAERDKALAASQAKTDFMGNMSHELRTPLNAIIGFSQMIENGLNEHKVREYAGDIKSSGGHLLNLIGDLLDLEKIERRKVELVESEFDILSTVEDSIRLARSLEDAIHRDIRIEVFGPPTLFFGDPRLMLQVMNNLLSNATKFSKDGGLVLVSLFIGQSGDLVIEVKDNGIGMSAGAVTQVFEPFVQANADITRTHGGTGLGLTIVKAQVELHGGQIEIESEEGSGTTISITLPSERVRTLMRDVA